MNISLCRRSLYVVTILGTSMAFGQAPGTSSPGRGGHSDASQAAPLPVSDAKPLLSEPERASIKLDGQKIMVRYSSPSRRGRNIMGELVPYDEVWRTGADAATSFVTSCDLLLGAIRLPAGSYTLYTLPAAPNSIKPWLLILNQQVGQWGTVYNASRDLVRVPMQARAISSPQEAMSISFKKEDGTSATMHIRWEHVDEFVTLTKAP